MQQGPFRIEDEFVVLRPDQQADAVPVSPALYEELDRDYNGFQGHALVSQYDFRESWSSWEMHPAGEEVVMLLAGSVTFVLEEEGVERELVLDEAGQYLIVPKGVWHTLRTSEPARLLFITPGEGTRHHSVADVET